MKKKTPLSPEQIEDSKRLKAIFMAKKKELKLSQESLAHELGVVQSAVSAVLNGVNAITVNNAPIYARILGVPISDFSPTIAKDIEVMTASLKPGSFEEVTIPKGGMVPVIGEAILGIDGMIDMVEFQAGWLQIYSADKEAYGLKVKGDSMHPRIQSGEFVVIEPNTPTYPGDEVFVRTTEGHNMIKIMNKTRDGDYQFTSINNDHKPITIAPEKIDKIHFVSAIVKSTRYKDSSDF
ncbi:LexA family transcriptional regulator [Serratia marcescens]|uniref:LexA family transcriptional regulator n=1 Tax=Serratia marcescens TaxID=615 RepID=UPI000F8E27CE|nr:XRE family transcriptional regulator [Serratia marcescens]